MKFVFNTRSKDAGVDACIYALSENIRSIGHYAKVNDWERYQNYDVAIFMGYDHDIDNAKSQNPKIKIILADPKADSQQQISSTMQADGIIVSSVEQREKFLKFNSACFVYHMFPNYQFIDTIYENRDDFFGVVYHGNQIHIAEMLPCVWPALQRLSDFCQIKLGLIYNIESLGKINFSNYDAENLKIEHIQWDPEKLVSDISKFDVGLLPNQIYDFAEEQEEKYYNLRFKSSANPGRFYPFACAGLPVISDFTPSASQYIEDGKSGFLAASPEGYFDALSVLCSDLDLREKMGLSLRNRVKIRSEQQHLKFVSFLEEKVFNRNIYNFKTTTKSSIPKLAVPKQSKLKRGYRRFVGLLKRPQR